MKDLNEKTNTDDMIREVYGDGQVWEFNVIRAEHEGVLIQLSNGDTQWLTNQEFQSLNEKRKR